MEQNSPQQSYQISEDVIYQAVEDELVLLNLKSQQYYGLDSMGSRMWHLLVEHRNPEAVADQICEEFDVDKATVLRDLQSMVLDFQAAGLVKPEKVLDNTPA